MLCVYCKGPHPYTSCTLFERALKVAAKVSVGTEFTGESPAPFIGHANYPNVSVGLLSVPFTKDTQKYDDPNLWASQKFTISEVANLRRSLLNARVQENIFKMQSKHIERVQEIALATRPVDVDVRLTRRPIPTLFFDETTAPYGPRASIVDATITSNPNTHTKIDKVVSDTDRTAASALNYLYSAGFSENTLNKILSVGAIGVSQRRKLVPTRRSITATDDILGNELLEKIKIFTKTHDCVLFSASYMGNEYYFILLPILFQYELFELYGPAFAQGREQYSTDFESHFGRTRYAEECAGGYYSVRLAIAEYLMRSRRQAGVFCLRVITDEYTTPLGVWVTRETARMAFNAKPMEFSTSELALQYVREMVCRRFGFSMDNILKRSKLLLNLQQTRLSQWT